MDILWSGVQWCDCTHNVVVTPFFFSLEKTGTLFHESAAVLLAHCIPSSACILANHAHMHALLSVFELSLAATRLSFAADFIGRGSESVTT